MKDNAFILVPLPMIKDLIKDPSTLEDIYLVGIYKSSTLMKYSDDQAIKHFIYCMYRRKDELRGPIFEWAKKMVDFPYDNERGGFDGGDFHAYAEFSYVKIFAARYPGFKRDLLEWSRWDTMHSEMEKYISAKIPNDMLAAKKIFEGNDYFIGEPNFTADSKIIWDLYKRRSLMTEEELASWAMYFGMLSLIGQKDVVATTSFAIKSRMFGAKDKEALDDILTDLELKKLYDRYTTRRKYEKLCYIVREKMKINSMGLKKKTYLSYVYFDDADLIEKVFYSDRARLHKERKALIAKYYGRKKQERR